MSGLDLGLRCAALLFGASLGLIRLLVALISNRKDACERIPSIFPFHLSLRGTENECSLASKQTDHLYILNTVICSIAASRQLPSYYASETQAIACASACMGEVSEAQVRN